jgi:hypothetical protein
MKTKFWIFGLIAVIALVSLFITQATVTSRLPSTTVNGTPIADEKLHQEVIAKAIEEAKSYGMDTDTPSKIEIKETTLAEWFQIMQFEPGPDAAKFGIDPSKPIWIVAMLATGTNSGPGSTAPGEKPSRFDNIAFAISKEDLKVIGGRVMGEDEPLPLGLQR